MFGPFLISVVPSQVSKAYWLEKCWPRSFIQKVAEWIHFTLFEIILPTIKLKMYSVHFLGLMKSATKRR